MNCSSYSKNAMVLKVRGYTRFLTHSIFILMDLILESYILHFFLLLHGGSADLDGIFLLHISG